MCVCVCVCGVCVCGVDTLSSPLGFDSICNTTASTASAYMSFTLSAVHCTNKSTVSFVHTRQ